MTDIPESEKLRIIPQDDDMPYAVGSIVEMVVEEMVEGEKSFAIGLYEVVKIEDGQLHCEFRGFSGWPG